VCASAIFYISPDPAELGERWSASIAEQGIHAGCQKYQALDPLAPKIIALERAPQLLFP
jgi:hypothetical protein